MPPWPKITNPQPMNSPAGAVPPRGWKAKAGSMEAPADKPEEDEHPDGDYGGPRPSETERVADGIREGLTDGQVNTTAEERGPLHG